MSHFDTTSSEFTFGSSTTIPSTGYDISEFDNDSRGTARVADWNDFENMSEDDFDHLVSSLSISSSASVNFFISWEDSTYLTAGEAGNKYYRDPSSGSHLGYMLYIHNGTRKKVVVYDDNNISSNPIKELHLTGRGGTHPVLVVFPGSSQASGDPHMTTFDGTKYTL